MRTILSIALFLMGTIRLSADTWIYPPEKKTTDYRFGQIRILLHYDSVGRPLWPKYTLEVKRGWKSVAEHADVGFEEVFASAENRFFLGVSNRGTTPPAAVVFDERGRILLRVSFEDDRLKYCFVTTTLAREWYESSNPDVEFITDGDNLLEVRINGCDGQRTVLPIALIKVEQDEGANQPVESNAGSAHSNSRGAATD